MKTTVSSVGYEVVKERKRSLVERFCHIECFNRIWIMEERTNSRFFKGTWVRTPYVKKFDCLSEARKAYITYNTNQDFPNTDFRITLKEVDGG